MQVMHKIGYMMAIGGLCATLHLNACGCFELKSEDGKKISVFALEQPNPDGSLNAFYHVEGIVKTPKALFVRENASKENLPKTAKLLGTVDGRFYKGKWNVYALE